MGSRIFCVCVIVITVLCARIVNSDVHIPSTRMRLSSGLSRQVPFKSHPASLKSMRSGIVSGPAPHPAEGKLHSFWSKFFGKSRSGGALTGAHLASAAVLAAHLNQTAPPTPVPKSLRVKRDIRKDSREATSAPKNLASTTKKSGVDQTTATSRLLSATSAKPPSKGLDGGPQATAGKTSSGTVKSAETMTTVRMAATTTEKKGTSASTKRMIDNVAANSAKSDNGRTMSATLPSAGAETSTGTTKKYDTGSLLTSKASSAGVAVTTGATSARLTPRTEAAVVSSTTKKSSVVETKTSTASVASSAKVTSKPTGKDIISEQSTAKKSFDDGSTLSTTAKSSALGSSTVAAKSGIFGVTTAASSLKVGSSAIGSASSTTKASAAGITTVSTKPFTDSKVTTSSNAAPQSNASTTRSSGTSQSNTATTKPNTALQRNSTGSNTGPWSSAATTRSITTSRSNTTMSGNNVTLQGSTATTRSNTVPRGNTATTRAVQTVQSNSSTTVSNAATTRSTASTQNNTITNRSSTVLPSNTTTAKTSMSPPTNATTPRSAVIPPSNVTTTGPTKGAVPLPSASNGTLTGTKGNSSANYTAEPKSQNVTRPKPTIMACPFGQVFCLRLWSCVASNDYYDLEAMRWVDNEVICHPGDVCQPSHCRKKTCELNEVYSLETDTCVKYSSYENDYYTEFPEFPHTTESPIHHSSDAAYMCPKGDMYILPLVVYCRVDEDCPLQAKCCYASKRDNFKLPSCIWIYENADCPSFMSYCSASAKCHLPTEACNGTCRPPWVFCNATNRCVEAGTCKANNSSVPVAFKPFELPRELSPVLKIKSSKPLLEDCDSRQPVSEMFGMEGLLDFPMKTKEKLLLRFLQEHLSWSVDHLEYYNWITEFSAVLSVKESSVELKSTETANKDLPFVPTVEFPCLDGILLQTAHNVNGNKDDLRWSNYRCGNAGLRMKFRNVARLHCRPNYYGRVTLHLSPLVVDVNGNKTYGKPQSMDIEVSPVHDPPVVRPDVDDVDVEIPFVTTFPLVSDPRLDEGTLVKDFTSAYFYNLDGTDLGMGVVSAQSSQLGFWEFKLADGSDWTELTDVDPACSTMKNLGVSVIHQGVVFLDGATLPDITGKARPRRSLIFFNDTVSAASNRSAAEEHPLSKKSQTEFTKFYSSDFRSLVEDSPLEEPENATDVDEYNITRIGELGLKNPWRQKHRSPSEPLECPLEPVSVTDKIKLSTMTNSQTTAGFSKGQENMPTAAPLTLTTTSKSGLTTTVILSGSSVASWNSAASSSAGLTTPNSKPVSANAAATASSSAGTVKSATNSWNSSTPKAADTTTSKSGVTVKSSTAQAVSTGSRTATTASANSAASSVTTKAVKLTTTGGKPASSAAAALGNNVTTSKPANNSSGNFTTSTKSTTSGIFINPKSSDATAKSAGSVTLASASSVIANSLNSVTTAKSTYSNTANNSINPVTTAKSANLVHSVTTAKSAGSVTTANSVSISTTAKSAVSNTAKYSVSPATTARSANLAYSVTTVKSNNSATTKSTNYATTSGVSKGSNTTTTRPGSSSTHPALSTARGETSSSATSMSSAPTAAMPTKGVPFWPDEDEVVAREARLETRVLFLPPTARLRFVRRNSTSQPWWPITTAMRDSRLAFLAWDGSDGKKAGSREKINTTLCTMQNEACSPEPNSALSRHVAVIRRRPHDCTFQASFMTRRVPDQCGVCGGDGRTCSDCEGTIDGDAVMDCSTCVGGSTGKPLYAGRDCDFHCSSSSAEKFGSKCFTSEADFKRCDPKSNTSLINECGLCTSVQNLSQIEDPKSTLCGHCANHSVAGWLKHHYFKHFNCDNTWKKDSMVEAVAFGLHPHLQWDMGPEFGQAVYADLAAFSGPVLLLHVYGPSWSYKKGVFESTACDLVNFAGVVVSPLKSRLLTDRLQIELTAVQVGDYRIACSLMTSSKNYYSLTPFSKLTVVDTRRVWIQNSDPSVIKAKQNVMLTILGEGFVNSSDLNCFAFIHPSKVAKLLAKANFVNERKATCNVSNTTFTGPMTVDVGVALSSLALEQYNVGRFPLLSSVTVEIRVDEPIHLLDVYVLDDWRSVIAFFDCNVQLENCRDIFTDMTNIFGKDISCKAKADTIIIYPSTDLNSLVGKALSMSKSNDVSCAFAPKSVPGAVGDATVKKPMKEVPLTFELIGPSYGCAPDVPLQVVALSGTGGKPVATRWKVTTSANDSAAEKRKESRDKYEFPTSALHFKLPGSILTSGLRYVAEVTITNFLKRELSRSVEFAFSVECVHTVTIIGPPSVNPHHDVVLTAQYNSTSEQTRLSFYWEVIGSPLSVNNVRGKTVMIERGSLEGGMTYIVQCLVIINDDPTIFAMDFFNLSTKLGEPVAMTSVTFLDVPVTKGFWLNGELSHDPYKPFKKLRFLWSCSLESGGACYSVTSSSVRRLEASLNSTVQDPILAVDGHLLAVGKYNFTLTVLTADGRQAKTSVLVHVIPKRNAPTISVAQGNDFAVRPGTEVTLRSFISAPAGTVLIWQCIPVRGKAYFDVSKSPSTGMYHLVETDYADVPFTTTLRPSMESTDPSWNRLVPDSVYMLTLTASHPIEGTTRAYVTLNTVASPAVRSVKVLPTSGVAIFTAYSVNVSDFCADETVSLLHIGFRDASRNDSSVRYLRQVSHRLQSIDGIRLPAASLNPGKFVLLVKACSLDDVCSISESSPIEVKMPDLSAKEHLNDMVAMVSGLINQGDFATAITHATSCIHTLTVAGYKKGATLQRLVWMTELLLRRQAARIEIPVDGVYSPREEAFDTLSAACSAFKDVRPSNHTLLSLVALQSKMMDAYVRRQFEVDAAPSAPVLPDAPTRIPHSSTAPSVTVDFTKGLTSVMAAGSSFTSSSTAGSASARTTASTTGSKSASGNASTTAMPLSSTAGSTSARATGGSSMGGNASNTSARLLSSTTGSATARTTASATGSKSASGNASTTAMPLSSTAGSTSARATGGSSMGGNASNTSARLLSSTTGSATARTTASATGSKSASGNSSTTAMPLSSTAGSTSARATGGSSMGGNASKTSARPLSSTTGSATARTTASATGSKSASGNASTTAMPLSSTAGGTSARAAGGSSMGGNASNTSARPLSSTSGSATARTTASATGSKSASGNANTTAMPLSSTAGSTSARATGGSSVGENVANTSARPLSSTTGSATARATGGSSMGGNVANTSSSAGSTFTSGNGGTSASPSSISAGSTSARTSSRTGSGSDSATGIVSTKTSVPPANGTSGKAIPLEKGPDSAVHIAGQNELEEHMPGGYVKQIVYGLKRLFRVGRSARRSQSVSRNSSPSVGARPPSSKKSSNSNQQAAKPSSSNSILKSSNAKPGSSNVKPASSNAIPASSNANPPASNRAPASSNAKSESSNAKPATSNAKPESSNTVPASSNAKPASSKATPEGKAEVAENKAAQPKTKVDSPGKKAAVNDKKDTAHGKKETNKYEKKAEKYDKKAEKYEKKAEKSKKKAEESKKKAEDSKKKAEEAKKKAEESKKKAEEAEKAKKAKSEEAQSSYLDVRHAQNCQMPSAYSHQNSYSWQQRRTRGTPIFIGSPASHRRYRYRRSPTKPGLLPGSSPPSQILPAGGDIGGNAYLVSEPNQPISRLQAEALLGITDMALAAGSASPAALYRQLLSDLPDLWMSMCLGALPDGRPVVATANTVVLQVAKVDAGKVVAEDGNYPFVSVDGGGMGFVRTSSYFHLNGTSKMSAKDFDCSGGQSDCGLVCLGSAHFKKDPLTTALGLNTNNPSTGLARGNVVALLPVFYADGQDISLLDVVDGISLNISVDAEDVMEAEIPYLKCAAWSNDRFSWNTMLCNTSNIFRGPKAIRVSCSCAPTGFFGLHLDRVQLPIKSVAETTTTTTTPVTPRTNPTTVRSSNATLTTKSSVNNASSAASTQSASVSSTSSPSSAARKLFYQVAFVIDADFKKTVKKTETFTYLMLSQFATLLKVPIDVFSGVTLESGSIKVTMVVTPDPNGQYGDGTQLVDEIHKLIAAEKFCFKGENNETLCAQKDSYNLTRTNNEDLYHTQNMVGTIVGCVFGAVILIVGLCILGTIVRNKMRRNKIAAMQASMADANNSVNYKHLQNAPAIQQTYAPIEGTIDSREQYRMRFAPSPNMVPNADGTFNYPSLSSQGLPDDPDDEDYLRPPSRVSTIVRPADPEPHRDGPPSVNPDRGANFNPSSNPQQSGPPSTLVNAGPEKEPQKPNHAPPPHPRANPPKHQ